MIIEPKLISEIPEIIREAAEKGEKIAVRGFSTQGKCPQGVWELNMRNFNSCDYGTEADLILTAGTGFRFRDLKKWLGEIAKDWPEYDGSVGGLICGERKLPAARHLLARIMGLTIVTGDGEIIGLGGKSVKDVAGYRIFPVFYGSGGKLGVAASVIINRAAIYRDVSERSIAAAERGNRQSDLLMEGLRKVFDSQGSFA